MRESIHRVGRHGVGVAAKQDESVGTSAALARLSYGESFRADTPLACCSFALNVLAIQVTGTSSDKRSLWPG
jgi:hypothetical protein